MSGSKHRLPIVHVIRVLLSYGGEKCTACLVITESGRRALLHGDKCRESKVSLRICDNGRIVFESGSN